MGEFSERCEGEPPRRIFESLADSRSPPTCSWMPDNRHVVLSASTAGGTPQLYLADTVSSALSVFSRGTRAQIAPAVSPDGKQLVFLESDTDFDVGSVDLKTAAITPEIATLRVEDQPSWAARDSRMVYITDRNGFQEVWLHEPGQADRPLVTSRDFPPGTTNGFANPDLSPDGARFIYRLITTGRPGGLWISAVAGGPPVRLVKGSKVRESGGSWSPDGKAARDLLPTSALVYAFSADGRAIYGLRQPVPLGPVELFSMSPTGGSEKTIGSLPRDYAPQASNSPGLRLTLTPDGKSLTYSISRTTSNLWLMDGIDAVKVR